MASEPDQSESSENKLPDIAPLPAASHPKKNTGAVENDPDTGAAADPGQELDQLPDDFKTFFKYLAKKEDDQILKEEEWARKEEECGKELCDILRESLKSSAEWTDRLQKAIESIKPNPSQNPKDKFWNAYRAVSEEHDDEFCAKHNGNLDTSLIFAGLFSAVSSAFIIQIQSNLIQNPDDVTQALLRLLIHSIDGSIFSGSDLIIPGWNGPPPSIVAAEGMLYISLFSTLLAALLAVLGKQWLAYYAGVGMRGTICERGIERQKKFDGLRRWGFEYVMMALPILLQISLLLFGAAMTVYLWNLQHTIAGIVLAISLIRIVAYLFFVLSDIFATNSLFRTPLSAGLIKIGTWIMDSSLSMNRLVNDVLSSCRNHFHCRTGLGDARNTPLQEQADENPVTLESTVVQQPVVEWEYPCREIPIFYTQAMGNRDEYDCLAVLWMLDTSTDPDVVAAAGSMAVGLQWSLNVNFIPPLTRLRDTFMGCFEGSPGLRLRESAMNHAIACGQAYRHLYVIHRSAQTPSQLEDHDVGFPEDFFDQVIGGGSYKKPFDSTELNFVYSQLREESSLVEYSSFSPSFFRWVLHISPYHHYFKSHSDTLLSIRIAERIRPSSPRFANRSSFTNSLLCLGSILEFPLNKSDITVINKGDYCEKVLEGLLQHFVGCNKQSYHSYIFSSVLETFIIYLKNMDHPPDLDNSHYREYIYQLCRAFPKDVFRTKAAFTAVRLVSGFQKDQRAVLELTSASEPSLSEGEEWIREVSEYIYQQLEYFDADNEWDDRIVEKIEDHLRVLIHVPHFGRYKPNHQFLRLLSKSMSLQGDKRKYLQLLAYSVICLACGHWFDDVDLQPMIQQLNIFSQLGPIVDGLVVGGASSYMEMIAKLSKMHAWIPIIRYDVHRWIHLYNIHAFLFRHNNLGEDFIPVFKNVFAIDDKELKRVGTKSNSVLALITLESVWRNFDFSARIAIESFCKLAKFVWTFLDPDASPIHDLSIKAVGEPFATRLGIAIHHARSSLLESRTSMEQEEIDAVEGISKVLMGIEEYLQERLTTSDHINSKQVILSQFKHSEGQAIERINRLGTSLQVLLTHPQHFLGTV